MIKLLAIGAAALLLLGLALAWQPPRAPSLYDLELESQQAQATATALAIQQAASLADAARWEAQKATLAPLITGLFAAVLVGAGALALTLAALGALRLARQLAPLVEVQIAETRIPLDRRLVAAGATRDLPGLIVERDIQRAIAAGAQVPHSLTLHNAYRNDAQGAPPAQLAAPVAVPPSIGEAAERGAFRDGRYILGYAVADGRPLTLDQADGRSLLIAGQGGSGGTTYLLASALQEILMPPYLRGQQESARFLLVDYHARKPGSLAERAAGLGDRIVAAAYTPAEVERALAAFNRECRARIGGAPTRYPLILLCDEISNLIDDADYAELVKPLLATLKHANNAYRAIGGKAIVRGHTLQASAWGNSAAVRGSFHARAGMRLDEGAAALLGIRPALAREMIALPAGQTFVTGPGLPLTHATASNVKGDDVGRILDLAGYRDRARTIHQVAPPAMADTPPAPEEIAASDEDRGVLLTGNWWETLTGEGSEGLEGNPPPLPESALEGSEGNPQAVRIYCLFMAGQPLPAVVETVYGVSSTTGGRRYQAALQEAQQLLRDEIARRRAHPAIGEAI